MNISRSQLSGVIKTYLNNSKQIDSKRGNKAKKNCTDEVNISNDVREFARAVKLISLADDIRTDKVDELKAKINNETYNIDGKLVAEKSLKNILQMN